MRVSTIHIFQGGEVPIIILDTTEGTGTKIAPMLDDTNRDSDAHLVLNVAFTRAESRLYLVAHTKHLLAGLHHNSSLSKIINYFRREAEPLESEILVDNYFTHRLRKYLPKYYYIYLRLINQLIPKGTNDWPLGRLYKILKM